MSDESDKVARREMAQGILNSVYEDFGEWIEMSDSPDRLVAEILATKIVHLYEHIELQNKRLRHVDSSGRVN